MDDTNKPAGGDFHYKGKAYAVAPSTMDRVKESFQTNDDRAQLEAIRRARQTAASVGIGSGS